MKRKYIIVLFILLMILMLYFSFLPKSIEKEKPLKYTKQSVQYQVCKDIFNIARSVNNYNRLKSRVSINKEILSNMNYNSIVKYKENPFVASELYKKTKCSIDMHMTFPYFSEFERKNKDEYSGVIWYAYSYAIFDKKSDYLIYGEKNIPVRLYVKYRDNYWVIYDYNEGYSEDFPFYNRIKKVVNTYIF